MVFEYLETPRLSLKRFSPEEYDFIITNYSKEEVIRELGLSGDEEYEKEKLKTKKGRTTYNISVIYFQLYTRLGNEMIGKCGFHNWNSDHFRAELGYALIDPTYYNKGYMKEALSAVLDYGFSKMKLQRVEAFVSPENPASLRIMKAFNFIKEGYISKHYLRNGIFEDSEMYSLLKENYKPKN